jgi:cell division protein FtsA
MKYFNMNPIYTVIDIGTTKIIVLIGELANSHIKILGIGEAESHGLAKGIVVDIESTTESIKTALNEATIQACVQPESVFIGISGNHIKSYFSLGMTSIERDGITQKTIAEAIAASQSIILPEDEKIIHTIPLQYIIDNNCIVKNPLGMHGMRLEINSHIITANKNAIADLISCCNRLGLKVKDIILEPIASAEGILNPEEKNLGALIVDIGGGTSDVALYKNNTIEYVEIIPIAGVLFTNDLAICLQAQRDDAESIKKMFGLIKPNDQESIIIKDIDMLNDRSINISIINNILHARSEELINYLEHIIKKYHAYYHIPAGIILTGGGALLKGLDTMVTKYTGIHCRIGIPRIENTVYESLNSPVYATAYGLLKYTISNDQRFKYKINHNTKSLIGKFKKWIENCLDN